MGQAARTMDYQDAGLKREYMPHHNTYRRILADVIDEAEFEDLAREHFKHCGEAGYQVVVSMDGKMARGTIDLEASDGLYLLAAYLQEKVSPWHK